MDQAKHEALGACLWPCWDFGIITDQCLLQVRGLVAHAKSTKCVGDRGAVVLVQEPGAPHKVGFSLVGAHCHLRVRGVLERDKRNEIASRKEARNPTTKAGGRILVRARGGVCTV